MMTVTDNTFIDLGRGHQVKGYDVRLSMYHPIEYQPSD